MPRLFASYLWNIDAAEATEAFELKTCPKYCPKCRKIFPPNSEFLNCPKDSAWLENLDSLINTSIAGKYLLTEDLGQDFFGAIYSAERPNSETDFVIKVLSPELTENIRHVERFRKFSSTLARLEHSGIARTVEFGLSPRPFLVMEATKGQTLRAIIKEHGRLSEKFTLALFKQLAETLQYAHALGEAHFNLNPENIVLSNLDLDAPEFKIINFGVSKLIDQDAIFGESGEVLGTPDYLSPEALNNQITSGEKADIYSLGCLIYECLAGKHPFKATNYIEWNSVHRLVRPMFADEERFSRLERELANIALHCLAKEPGSRPGTAELVASLDAQCHSASNSSKILPPWLNSKLKLVAVSVIVLFSVVGLVFSLLSVKKVEPKITKARTDKKSELVALLGSMTASGSVSSRTQVLRTGGEARILVPVKAHAILLLLEQLDASQNLDSLSASLAKRGFIVATLPLEKASRNAAGISSKAKSAIDELSKLPQLSKEPGTGFALVTNGIELNESLVGAKALAKNNENSELELSALLILNPTVSPKNQLNVADLHSIDFPVFYVLDAALEENARNAAAKQCINAFSYGGKKQMYYNSSRVSLTSVPVYTDQQVLCSLISGFFDAHLGHDVEKEALLYSPKAASAVNSAGELRFR